MEEKRKCQQCGNEMILRTKDQKRRKRFCDTSCAAKFNNKRRREMSDEQKKKISESLKEKWRKDPDSFPSGFEQAKNVGKGTKGKYRNKEEVNSLLEFSKRTVSKIIKRLGIGCSRCGWNEASCDIHHIQGKKIENCDDHSNLTILCPNCHRMVHDGKIDESEFKTLKEILPEHWIDYYYG